MKIVDPHHEPNLPPVLVEFTGLEAWNIAEWGRLATGLIAVNEADGAHPGVVVLFALAEKLAERY